VVPPAVAAYATVPGPILRATMAGGRPPARRRCRCVWRTVPAAENPLVEVLGANLRTRTCGGNASIGRAAVQ
jgi:hypothetical protein